MTPVSSLYRESHKINTYIEILAVKRLRESTVKEAKKLSDQNVTYGNAGAGPKGWLLIPG